MILLRGGYCYERRFGKSGNQLFEGPEGGKFVTIFKRIFLFNYFHFVRFGDRASYILSTWENVSLFIFYTLRSIIDVLNCIVSDYKSSVTVNIPTLREVVVAPIVDN